MSRSHAVMFGLALGGLASAAFRVADTLPALDPLLLLGLSLIVAGTICWRHAD